MLSEQLKLFAIYIKVVREIEGGSKGGRGGKGFQYMFYVSVDLGFWLDKCFRQAKVRKASDSSSRTELEREGERLNAY